MPTWISSCGIAKYYPREFPPGGSEARNRLDLTAKVIGFIAPPAAATAIVERFPATKPIMLAPMKPQSALLELADHLHARREALLNDWREAVRADSEITTALTLARTQFIDHIPRILDAFERRLRGAGEQTDEERKVAAEHGVDRWLHGYHYRETMREWGHLQTALANEVEAFSLAHADLDPMQLSTARRFLTELFVECMVESAAGHVRLQETEAASRLRDLEQLLANVQTLEQQRAELWHEAAHDLRGNVGAVQLNGGS